MIKNYLFLLPILFLTCDKSALISLDTKYEKLVFSCGEINIDVHSTKGVYFDLNVKFKTTKEFTINPNMLEISHLGEEVPYDLYQNKIKLSDNNITINRDEQINLEFSLLGNPKGTHNIPAKVGDTILIHADKFLKCDGKSIFHEPLFLIVDKIN